MNHQYKNPFKRDVKREGAFFGIKHDLYMPKMYFLWSRLRNVENEDDKMRENIYQGVFALKKN